MSYRGSARFYDFFDTKGNLGFYLEVARGTTGAVLELGVGTGRVLFEIGKMGREVVGIDNSPSMLREAERKLATEYPELRERCHLIEADIRSWDLGRPFGFIFSASSGLQELGVDDLPGVFRAAADHLEDDGILAFDLVSPSSARKSYSGLSGRKVLGDGGVVVRYINQVYREDSDSVSIDLFYEVFDSEGRMTEKFHEFGEGRAMEPELVEELLGTANLTVRSVHGDFVGNPYQEKSKWLVVVAQK